MLSMNSIIEGQFEQTGLPRSQIAYNMFPRHFPAPEIEETEERSDSTVVPPSKVDETPARDGSNKELAEPPRTSLLKNRLSEHFLEQHEPDGAAPEISHHHN